MAPLNPPDFEIPQPSGLAHETIPTGPGLNDGPAKRFFQRIIKLITVEPEVDERAQPAPPPPAEHR
jgi:hypothetical protein